MFSVKVGLSVLFIALGGLGILSAVEKYFKKSDYYFVIQVSAIAVILNIMMFVFLVSSFSKVTFEPGPQGPQGIRGPKGDFGTDGKLNQCGADKSLTAEDIKFETKRREVQLPKKPVIIED
jgi:hypothetical protein